MELRHLRCFQAVAKELHFGRAAEKLCIEPSPLSRTIKQLETELGVLLFFRNPRHTELTEEGKLLLQNIDHIFQVLEEIKKDFNNSPENRQRTLKVTVSDEIDIFRFSEVIRLFREHEPQFNFQFTQLTYEEQIKGIASQTYDLAFCKSNKIKNKNLIIKKIWEEELIVLLPSHHPMLKHRELAIQSILKYPLIYFAPEIYTGYDEQLKNICNSVGIQPKIVCYVKTYEMMLALVGAGYGISFVASSKFNHFKNNIVVSRQIHDGKKRIKIKTFIMSSSNSFHAQEVQKFLKYIVN